VLRNLIKDDVVGIFPPVCTPFDANEEIDLPALRREINSNVALGVSGICLGGTTGEGYSLKPEELGLIIRTAQNEVNGKIPVMAGIITTNTRDAVERGKVARDAGAQALMITPPVYLVCSDNGVYDYYATIHKETGMPIVVYNVLVGATVSVDLMTRLAYNQHETGLIGTKESIGGSLEGLTELLDTIGDRISVTWAHDWLLFAGLAIGARGSISGAAALLPRHCLAMWNAIQSSNIARAQELNFVITDVCNQISKKNWVAGVKACMNLQGRAVGNCRGPYNRVPDEQIERIRNALKRADAVDFSKAA
jgi:dihydrodipicolinate synthase/N-acetylneuraminate lyase